MPTIGVQLKQAREARKLNIQQVVQAIRIRAYYLEAMEADDFSAMPSPAQARGFFRSYADFLGLDAEALISIQRAESTLPAEFTSPAPLDQTPEKPTEPEKPAPETIEAETPQPEAEIEALQPETAPLPEESAAPPLSQLILIEIGQQLRQRRELLSLTLDEIERHTRVRKHYLEKIEAGNYDELPSPVQSRGMLSNYASFLDIDAEALLLRYADALQARRLERQPATAARSGLPRPRAMLPVWLGRFVSPDLLFGGGMILVLFFLTLWGANRIFSGTGPGSDATRGPSIPDVLLASPVALTLTLTEAMPTSVAVVLPTSVSTSDGTGTATETETPTDQPASNVQVTISILERAFIRVTVDGEVVKEERVVPGAALTFQGKERIEILTGSGSAIQVLFNGRDLGVMGNFGEVMDRVYSINGVQTPTFTPSPTLTLTPRFQRTPTPTPDVTPTIKPKPTSTPTVKK